MEQHSSGKPRVNPNICKKCKQCQKICAHSAISYDKNGVAKIDHFKCVGCGRCVGVCNFDAIKPAFDEANDVLNMKMAEYAYAVIKDKPNFHISLICDVSPNCDCHSENDAPIVPDIGMLVSFDMVALDKACVDLVNKQTAFENSVIGDKVKKSSEEHHDYIHMNHPDTHWQSQITHGEKIGLGSSDYELITIK